MSDSKIGDDALKRELDRHRLALLNEPKERREREKKNRKSVVKGARLRRTGREQLWTFRCNLELIERCKAHVKKQGVPIAAWMEEVLEAALASEEEGDKS